MKFKVLMTVSVLTLMAMPVAAQAGTDVLCSVRANMKSATYQPGVDVNGKAVAPADMNAPAMAMPKTLTIPLTIDLAQRMNEVLPTGSKLEAKMGTVEISADGHVMIDGKDMTGPTDTMCATIEKQREDALKTASGPISRKAAVHHAGAKKSGVKKRIVGDAPKMEAVPAGEMDKEPVPAPEAAPAPKAEAPETPKVLGAEPPAAPEAAPAMPAAQPTPPTVPATPDAAPTPPASGAAIAPAGKCSSRASAARSAERHADPGAVGRNAAVFGFGPGPGSISGSGA